MAKLVVEESKDFPTLPADSILFLKVEETKVKDVTGQNNSSWQKLEFKFKIMGIQAAGDNGPVERFENLIGTPIWGSVPFRLTDNPENKLRLWAEAILNMPLGVGFELDTDYLEGRQVRGVTSVYDKRNINPQTGKPFQNHQVSALLPIGDGPQAQAQPTPQPTPQPAQPANPWGSTQQSWEASQAAQTPWNPLAPQPQQPSSGGFTDEAPF